MTRRNLTVPLLIGGATTSAAHTAVKIAPAYEGTAVHVIDASRAVGVVGDAINRESALRERTNEQYAALRERHSRKKVTLVDLETARAGSLAVEQAPPAPRELGRWVLEPAVEDLVELIDWTPFFTVWELRGTYPKILDDPRQGAQARQLFDEAREMLDQLIREDCLTARGIVTLWPAHREGDDIVVEPVDAPARTLHTLRQQRERANGYAAMADFVAESEDHLGGFAVSVHGADERAKAFRDDNDDYNAIMVQALADRLAEAFAEWAHMRVRRQWWGYAPEEDLPLQSLIRERYDGIRPAPGYPAQPDHTEKRTLFELLDAGEVGMELTESCAMTPTSAVSGLYFAHADSRYFAVGKLAKDQVEDYAHRKNWSLEEAERWLMPNLGYTP